MKIKQFILVFSVFIFPGLSATMAENPENAVGTNETTPSADYTGLSTPFSVQMLPGVFINESEIRAGLLYDVANARVVWQKNISSAYPIASLTKMMVALLTVEDVRSGKFAWTDNVSWTRETIVGRRNHTKKIISNVNYSLRDVFKATMIASNNECSEQMARFIGGGNLQLSIDRMNSRAKELGMMNTFYSNPTGLPAPHMMFDNSSSPSDLLLLTIEMLKYSEVLEISAMGYAAIENGKTSSIISNHNKLTIEYSGEVDGLKTGYTKRAGFCLVATTAKCEHRLVSIVLGCRAPVTRNVLVRDMVNNYYTSIGLDKLGPFCPSPLIPEDNIAQTANVNGKYITINESVKKIHIVKSGESLSTIAMRYKCSTSQLKEWNKKIVRNNVILKGQNLVVMMNQPKSIFIQNPINGSETEDDKPLMTTAEKEELNNAEEKAEAVVTVEKVVTKPAVKYSTIENAEVKKSPSYLYHTVAPGDTLFNIARRYEGVSVDELKALNKITDINNLKPGTRLKVKVRG